MHGQPHIKLTISLWLAGVAAVLLEFVYEELFCDATLSSRAQIEF